MVGLVAARKAAKRALMQTYHEGVCSVTEYQSVRDEVTKITRQQEVTVLKEQPCKLSFDKLSVVVQSDTAAAKTQTTTLFLAPEIQIRAGSKVTVTQNGITTVYKASGEPSVYATHREVPLELYEEWS